MKRFRGLMRPRSFRKRKNAPDEPATEESKSNLEGTAAEQQTEQSRDSRELFDRSASGLQTRGESKPEIADVSFSMLLPLVSFVRSSVFASD